MHQCAIAITDSISHNAMGKRGFFPIRRIKTYCTCSLCRSIECVTDQSHREQMGISLQRNYLTSNVTIVNGKCRWINDGDGWGSSIFLKAFLNIGSIWCERINTAKR
jgi:hypothetical protein